MKEFKVGDLVTVNPAYCIPGVYEIVGSGSHGAIGDYYVVINETGNGRWTDMSDYVGYFNPEELELYSMSNYHFNNTLKDLLK